MTPQIELISAFSAPASYAIQRLSGEGLKHVSAANIPEADAGAGQRVNGARRAAEPETA